MQRCRDLVRGLCAFVVLIGLLVPANVSAAPRDGQVSERLSGLGVPFIANEGQVDERVAYYAPTFTGTVFVTRQGEVVYGLSGRRDAAAAAEATGKRPGTRGPGWTLTETFRGGKVAPAGQEPSPTTVSSFRGNDPARWRGDLPTFGEVGLGEVWPGVSVALKARGRSVEKIFTVAPGMSVDRIRMRVNGAQALRLGAGGALVAKTGLGDVTFTPPVAFQERDGGRTMIPVAYRVRRSEYRFTVGAYDRTRPLVIDPILQSTYLGGGSIESTVSLAFHEQSKDIDVGTGEVYYMSGKGADVATAVLVRPDGSVYVAGITAADTAPSDFPGVAGGARPTRSADGTDLFVLRHDDSLQPPPVDLVIAKTHVGHFGPGQIGAKYTLLVTNAGSAATTSTVTVTDTLPGGLTATGIGGTGWTCALDLMTCTRDDALAPAASWPAITVTVNVSAHVAASVTNTATVSGGGDVNPTNDVASDLTLARPRFEDVPGTDPFFAWIEALADAGVTKGCSATPSLFCPDANVTRGEIAVFILRGLLGPAFVPTPATGLFADVPLAHPFVRWIEALFRTHISGGCGTDPLRFCPGVPITRGQVAVLLLRAKLGVDFVPPAPSGMFSDIPVDHPFAGFIEELARRGITGGCGPDTFCPDASVTREQMAVLIVRTFALPM